MRLHFETLKYQNNSLVPQERITLKKIKNPNASPLMTMFG